MSERNSMIPKIIHYCWFGGNPKPKLVQKCIKSWKKYCSDYEFIEWNEENFDVKTAPLYVQQAYEAKKWAFVSDYVRLYAMVEHGGIYMDTDVEVIGKLDKFLVHEAFSGFEDEKNVPTGIMACRKEFPLFKEFLSYYDTAEFYKKDGTLNLTTNVETMTKICLSHGLILNNKFQEIEGFTVYPKEFFCPISYMDKKKHITRNTVTIHWFSGSWKTKESKKKEALMWKKRRKKEFFHYVFHIPHRVGRCLLGDDKYEKLKKVLK